MNKINEKQIDEPLMIQNQKFSSKRLHYYYYTYHISAKLIVDIVSTISPPFPLHQLLAVNHPNKIFFVSQPSISCLLSEPHTKLTVMPAKA